MGVTCCVDSSLAQTANNARKSILDKETLNSKRLNNGGTEEDSFFTEWRHDDVCVLTHKLLDALEANKATMDNFSKKGMHAVCRSFALRIFF